MTDGITEADLVKAERIYAEAIAKLICANRVLRYSVLGLEAMSSGSIRRVLDRVEQEIRDTSKYELEVPASFAARKVIGRKDE